MLSKNIITLKDNTMVYPNKPAVLCDVLDSTNTKYETTITPIEAQLFMYITEIKSKLTDKEYSKFFELIEEYRSETIQNS